MGDLGIAFAIRRSTSTSCAGTRTRSSASSPAAWPAWPRRARSRPARLRRIFSTPTTWKSRNDRRRPGQDRREADRPFEQCIIAAGSQAVRLPFIPDDPRIVDSTGALELRQHSQEDAGHRRRHHRPGDGHGLLHAGRALDVVEMLDGLMPGRPRSVKVWEKMNAHRFDRHHAQDQDGRGRGQGRRHPYVMFEGDGRHEERSSATTWCCRPWGAAQRQQDRRREGRRHRHRPRLHPGRQPDADQRAAHLRHRRHRRPAHAGAQGGARGPRRGRSLRRRQKSSSAPPSTPA
jgi:hypothetical protein